MTAPEAIQAVEARGGWITLNGDKIRCKVPQNAVGLVDALRDHKAAIVQILRQRAGVLADWISRYCVGNGRASANPKVLYREYRRACSGGVLSYDEFLRVLALLSWQLDENDMIAGVCLADDFLRAVELDCGRIQGTIQ